MSINAWAVMQISVSNTQALDAGIIKCFKDLFRKSILSRMVTLIDRTEQSAGELVKSVTVFNACEWIHQAWNGVRAETIVGCFRNVGIGEQHGPHLQVLNSQASELENELQNLSLQAGVKEYIKEDEEEIIPICDTEDCM